MTSVSDEELLDLCIFLEYADIDYCDICGWSINVRTYGNKRICRHCIEQFIREDKVHVCDGCGEVLLDEDINRFEEDGMVYYYCDDCARNEILICTECGRPTRRRTSSRLYNELGGYDYVCHNCAEQYPRCEDCGNLYSGEMINGICKRCYDKSHWRGEAKRYGYHDWRCEHRWNFYNEDGTITLEPRDNEIYLGTETEIDTDNYGRVEAMCDRLNRKLGGLTHFERDASLGGSGIEIISMPMVLSQHMCFKDNFQQAFEKATDFQYWCDRSTGLHVHVSTTVLGEKHHKRLLYMLDKFKQNVLNLSRRTSDYASYYTIRHITGHDFDEDWEPRGCDLSYYLDWIRDHSGHGIYMNYNDYPASIEFRMFGGTLDIINYIGTIQFVYRCITAVQVYTLDQLRTMSFEDVFKGHYTELDELIERTKNLNVGVRR